MLLIGFIVPRSPRQSPAIPYAKMSYLAGPRSSIRTAVLRFEGRVWTALCCPVPSGALGSPPAGPCRGPGPLRTLVETEAAGFRIVRPVKSWRQNQAGQSWLMSLTGRDQPGWFGFVWTGRGLVLMKYCIVM